MQLDFRDYLRSLCDSSDENWGDRYTPTEAELPLKVQTVTTHQDDLSPGQRETPKKYEVLAGLREYATQHVLLLGKPGSGKSTALRRLLWEEAQKALSAIENGQPDFKIPVLIELRDRRGGSVITWVQKALRRVTRDEAAIEDLLLDGRLLLLFDGLNEIPLPDMWAALDEFQRDRDFQSTPRIFTTRELGVGSDLGIEKKLEMLPLTEPQMREFIELRLPGQSDRLFTQLKDRLRELAETPLLLEMLCDVVQESPEGQLPQNRGQLFQKFVEQYDQFKSSRTLPISSDSRRFAPELLQHLAFVMVQGDPDLDPCKATPSWLTIPKTQAEKVLEICLTGRVDSPAQKAKTWLEDLLNYHLLQVASDPDQVEFHHQLFQEYYAAKQLLELFPYLDETKLKQDYLNYLKWYESLIVLAGLIKQPDQAVKLIRTALTVDWQLGAKLIGELPSQFQPPAVEVLNKENLPLKLRLCLLGLTRSEAAVPRLLKALAHKDSGIRWRAACELGTLGSEQATFGLLMTVNDQDPDVWRRAAISLGEIGSKQAVPGLLYALESNDAHVRYWATRALGEIQTEQVIPGLIQAVSDEDLKVRRQATKALSNHKSREAVSALIQALEDEDWRVRKDAVSTLGKIKAEQAVPALISILKSKDFYVSSEAASVLAEIQTEQAIRELLTTLSETHVLGGIGKTILYAINKYGLKQIVETFLIEDLKKSEPAIRREAASTLGLIKSKKVVPYLISLLEDENKGVRESAAIALGDIKDQRAIPALLAAFNKDINNDLTNNCTEYALGELQVEAIIPILIENLNHEELWKRRKAAESLGRIKSQQAVSTLISALEDEDDGVRKSAAEALGKIQSEEAIKPLIYALKDTYWGVQQSAAEALGELKAEQAVPALIETLDNDDICEESVKALGKIQAEEAVPALVKTLEKHINDFFLGSEIAKALGKIRSSLAVPSLLRLLFREAVDDVFSCGKDIAEALGEIGSEQAVPGLIKALKRGESLTSSAAAAALTKIGSQEAIAGLVNALEDPEYSVYSAATEALKQVDSPQLLPAIHRILLQQERKDLLDVISAIQSKCGFYRYELAQAGVERRKKEIEQGKPGETLITYQIQSVGILNTGAVTVQGDQVGMRVELPFQDGECSD